MKPKRPKPDASLLDQLSAPLRDCVADIKAHGAEKLKQLHDNPQKYLELSIRLIELIASLRTESGLDFKSAKSMEEIGTKLLKSVGMDEHIISPEMIEAAIEANNAFIAQLEAIRDRHEVAEGEIH